MTHDIIDGVIDQWHTAHPHMDARCLGVVGRILRLADHLERRANESLKKFKLPVWAFDVLGTLRRRGKPYTMTPTELMQSVMRSSGAITNRIDRLERRGLIERIPDLQDRRSMKVRLTQKGLKLIDEAAPARFREAHDAVRGLPADGRQILSSLLREMLQDLEARDAK